jgi:hypothetical protein
MQYLTSVLLLAATALALPNPLPEAVAEPATTGAAKPPTNTTITFYTGGSSNKCGDGAFNIGQGNLTAGECKNLFNSAFSIPYDANFACTFTLWQGSTSCGQGSTGKVVTKIPKGTSGSACIDTGVVDGGKWYHGSGIWKCA